MLHNVNPKIFMYMRLKIIQRLSLSGQTQFITMSVLDYVCV
jgi:hypothetical protein